MYPYDPRIGIKKAALPPGNAAFFIVLTSSVYSIIIIARGISIVILIGIILGITFKFACLD
jgi:hypothetical protein